MAVGIRSIDGTTPKRRLITIATGAAYLLVTGAALIGVQFLVQNPMTSTLIGALVVAIIATRARLESEEDSPPARRRGGIGAAVTLALIVALVSIAMISGATLLILQPGATILFGAAEAFASAYIAEIWLHGMTLHFARRASVSLRYAYPYAVLAGLAPTLLVGGFEPTTLVLAAASGAFFTALWVRGGDAWAPIAAHFVWVWVTDSLLAGDMLDLSSAAGRIVNGPGSTGLIAWLAAAGFSTLTLLVLMNKLALPFAKLPEPDDDDP